MKNGFILKKLLVNVGILFVVITLNFFLPRLIYSDPATPYYFDFGTSYIYKEPVFNVMFKRIPWSLVLSLSMLVISVTLGIIFGAVAAKNRGKWQDSTILRLSTLSTAIPTFWLAMVSVMLFAFTIPVFPYRGAMTEGYTLVMNKPLFAGVFFGSVLLTVILYLIFRKGFLTFTVPLVGLAAAVGVSIPFDDIADIAYHAFLPVVITAIGSTISYALLVRNSMISVVNEDYILTARAKGVPARKILFGHTFRNALLPLVTSIGLGISGLIGGSVLMEQIFTWPGMGNLLLEANNNGDFQLAQAILLLFAIITIAANFITDLIYHKLDPRVGIV